MESHKSASRNPLAHLKHRDPERWHELTLEQRWLYDWGWDDATVRLIQKEFDATEMEG